MCRELAHPRRPVADVPPADLRERILTGRPAPIPRSQETRADRAQWVTSRAAALQAIGLPPRVAAALVAHYARETGWGRSEWNYALGNIRWRGTGPAFLQQGSDDPVPRPYRAYDSLEDGVRGAVGLASSGRYAAGWQALMNGGREIDWYLRLMVPAPGTAGWHPYSDNALDEYASVLGTVRDMMGLPAVPRGTMPYYRGGPTSGGGTGTALASVVPTSGVSTAGVLFVLAASAALAGVVLYRSGKLRL